MTLIGSAQIALVLALVFASAFPLGKYMATLFSGGRTFLTPVLGPVERGFYALAGVDARRGMGWREYAFALILLNALHFVLLYAILRLQDVLPFNPQHVAAMSPRLAFNTAASFVTNTNWQAYSPESQISYGAQMFGLTVHNFLSAATGIAAAVAVVRAFAGSSVNSLGNFYVDLTRVSLYLLLPVCVVIGVVLMAAGVPETLAAYATATPLDGGSQTIAFGPVAFQEAIKEFGTNGGGFFNANSAHPFENPSALTNVLENWLLLVIPFALPLMLGHMVGEKKQGRALFYAMAIHPQPSPPSAHTPLEAAGNPLLTHAGISTAMGNMEGKEVRFGTALSSVFNISATGTSTGAVDSFTDSYHAPRRTHPDVPYAARRSHARAASARASTLSSSSRSSASSSPASWLVEPLNISARKFRRRKSSSPCSPSSSSPSSSLGGAGLVARPPQRRHPPSAPPARTACPKCSTPGHPPPKTTAAPWPASRRTHACSITASACAMIFGRFAFMIPVLAIAGSLAAKPKLPPSAGTFPTTGPLFVGLLIGVIIILGGLQFMPADALGPLSGSLHAYQAGITY